jgi:hypothetical protein
MIDHYLHVRYSDISGGRPSCRDSKGSAVPSHIGDAIAPNDSHSVRGRFDKFAVTAGGRDMNGLVVLCVDLGLGSTANQLGALVMLLHAGGVDRIRRSSRH